MSAPEGKERQKGAERSFTQIVNENPPHLWKELNLKTEKQTGYIISSVPTVIF